MDHTTATALYDPKDPFNEAVAAFYVQVSGGLGSLYGPVLSLTAGDAERPGLLGYIQGLRFQLTCSLICLRRLRTSS
ncbi:MULTISPECIES: hypothetical protein [unclassified Streptomyces]|uniref:hypothetical protein n=1 Tax=unclassified Streptomyces TaxID=2593676 RepID=UPI003809A60A